MVYGLGHQIQGVSAADEAFPGLARQVIQSDTYANAETTTRQTYVISLGAAVNDTDYVITYSKEGVDTTITYTSDSSATQAEINAGLLAAAQADASFGQYFTIASTDTAELTLTGANYGVNTTVSVSGGNATGVNTAATVSSDLPYGRVVVLGSVTTGTNGLGTVKLPSATGQTVAGITIATHSIPRRGDPPNETVGYRSTDPVAVLRDGTGWVTSETPFNENAFVPTTVYFRHTADGALTDLGVLASGSGTGLDQLSGVRVLRPSITQADGTYLVPLAVNI